MGNKKTTGDYYRNIIKAIKNNVKSLEDELVRYKDERDVVRVIMRNLDLRRKQVRHYEMKLEKYIKEGWVE